MRNFRIPQRSQSSAPSRYSFSKQSPYLASLLFLAIVFSGCLTPRKMDKWIDSKYEGMTTGKIKSNDYLVIKTENIKPDDKISTTQKGKTKFIPALVYWHWEFSNVSTLNPYIPVSHFSAALLPYANSKGMRQKLNGQKIELTIDKAPAVFSLTDKGNMIYLGLWYVGWESIYIQPDNQELVVSYRLLKNNTEMKKGVIAIANRDQPIALKMFQSPKKMTWRYLDQYNNNIKSMSKELVDRLMVEL